MPTSIESRNAELNRFHVLRYDDAHKVDHAEVGEPSPAPLVEAEPFSAGSANMDVNGPGPVQSAFPIKSASPPAGQPAEASVSPISSPTDEVEISAAGKMMESIANTEVRAERLAQIKAEIDAGTYETDEKLEAALSRMLGRIDTDT